MSILHRRRATNTRSCIQMLCMTFDYCNALSCAALRPATSRNFNVCRTTQLWSCSKCQDDPTPSRCCTACTGWSENHIQDGGGHIQSPAHRNASLSWPILTAAQVPQLCTEFTVVGHSCAVSTFHQNWFRQTWFPLLSSCRLELTS